MVTSTSIIGPKKAEIMDVWTVEGANSTGHPNGILHALCSSETLSHKIRDQNPKPFAAATGEGMESRAKQLLGKAFVDVLTP